MTTDKALAALAKSSLVSTTSYLAPLLVVGNQSQTTHSMAYPSRDCRTSYLAPFFRSLKRSASVVYG